MELANTIQKRFVGAIHHTSKGRLVVSAFVLSAWRDRAGQTKSMPRRTRRVSTIATNMVTRERVTVA